MSHDRQFAASPDEVFDTLVEVITAFEKLRNANPATREITFATKVGGWAWGSHWRIQVQPAGNGALATAAVVSTGSMAAETSEDTRIRKLWDAADEVIARIAPASDLPARPVAQEINAALLAGFPAKHRGLIGPILTALAEAEEWAARGDVVTEELLIQRAERMAASAGPFALRPTKWCQDQIHQRMADGRLRRDVDFLGRVGANLLIMSDRVIQGTLVQALDEQVQASVAVGGQLLQSTRPTLTRMAVGSVLPGSALLVGLAVPKAKTTDLRTASFILAHPSWRLLEPIDPDRAHEVSGLTAQINLIASQRRRDAQAHPPAAAAPMSVADELTKLAGLHNAGILSEEEFVAAKARLLA